MPPDARKPLTARQIQAQLPAHWTGSARAIEREFRFGTYQQGVNFAVQVAALAEQQNHHPDILIGYKRVKVTYSTHDAGGVTAMDIQAGNALNQLQP